MKNLSGVDLNLLVAFDALMRERNVTRAADRIGLAQPSMSNALARLRALLNDELFVRTPAGMRPTPVAERIAPHVSDALEAADRAINDNIVFDPSVAEFSISLSTTDYVEFIFLPAITRRLRQQAPNAVLRILPLDRNTLNTNLDSGEVDLAIGVPGPVPKRQMARKLLDEVFVCIARKNHPGIRGQLNLETFLQLSHALVSLRGDAVGVVDNTLAKRGSRRHVAVSTASFTGLPFLIAETDLIAVTPRHLAARVAQYAAIDIHPVPFELTGFGLTMVWGKGTASAAHQIWFRQLISEIVVS